jgi:undecaprenyl phosphate-alpha-L-ara4N flippase subunit ArnE
MDYLLIFIVVMLTSSGQVLQKLGAERGLKNADGLGQSFKALFQWEIILSGICLVAAVSVWLIVLYRMDVSKAFPFVSLGFIVVLLFAHYFLQEKITRYRWIGVCFIVAGISLLSQT